MFSKSFEARILLAAQAAGLVRTESGGCGEEFPAPCEGEGDSLWSERLASLVQAGELSQTTVDTLAWDAIGREAGSWVDPLFRGPAPIGDLPGLGDRYQNLVPIGSGAHATVFKALDTLLQRDIALKLLRDGSGRALNEARSQAKVEHPNVCRVYEVGQGFLVMQLVEGPTLAQVAGELTQTQKLRLLRDIALGIHAAHLRGLIHLDLKLNNVLLQKGEDGEYTPVVSDFGMMLSEAPPRDVGCPMGTPPYTSPEQLRGDPTRLDRRSDIYSMGVMLYVLLAGVIPFEAKDFPALLHAMANDSPVPLRCRKPELARDLEAVVHRCLARNPEARYASAKELAEELDHLLEGAPVQAMGAAWGYRLARWARRNRRMAWVAGMGLLAFGGVIVGFVHHLDHLAEQRDWDQHFQGRVEELRTQLDRVFRKAAHDIEPELAQIRNSIPALEQEISKAGPAARGPGQLALGQAKLLLDAPPEEVGAHFQRAWDLGFHTERSRTWLVYAQIQRLQKAQEEAWVASDPKAQEQLRQVAHQGFLGPVREMFKGRQGASQVRLLYLAELNEARISNHAPDRKIQLARSLRASLPGDLDAVMEEAKALKEKADQLWIRAANTASGPTPLQEAEVESLRTEALGLLEEAHRQAPSHPRVLALLGSGQTGLYKQPTRHQGGQNALQAGEAWFQEGFRVSRSHRDLNDGYMDFQINGLLDSRLRQGDEGSTVVRRILDGLASLPPSPLLTNRDQGLTLRFYLVAKLARYGRRADDLLAWIQQDLLRDATPTQGKPLGRELRPLCAVVLAPHLTNSGGDPRPLEGLIQRLLEEASASHYRGIGFLGMVQLLEHDLLLGREVSTRMQDLERHRQALAAEDRDAVESLVLYARARAWSDEAAWSRLERLLAQGKLGAMAGNPVMVQRARLTLLRHRLDRGEPVEAPLAALRQELESRLTRPWEVPAHLVHEQLAELCLLEARTAQAPVARLREGLQEAERAMDYAPARGVNPDAGITVPPHQAQTQALRGELLMALAEATITRSERQDLGRLATRAFAAALAENGNLGRVLAPLQARALALGNR